MTVVKDFLWAEKYRPRTVGECILPHRLKNPFTEFVAKGEFPNLLLSGGAGVGKTTIALAALDESEIPHLLINASKERGIETIREKLVNYGTTLSFSGKRKVAILDEADNLTDDAQKTFRGVMEEFSHNLTYILTCNYKKRLIEPIHSRCIGMEFKLTKEESGPMKIAFIKRMMKVLREENVEFDPQYVVKVVEYYFPDYRRTLNELQHFAASGSISERVLDLMHDVRNMDKLFEAMGDKDFKAVRTWVGENNDLDALHIYKRIYDDMRERIEPSTNPHAVLILAKYQFQHAFVGLPELNLMACLTELMDECTFK
jgi:DNA polymerase III delta prime subunit